MPEVQEVFRMATQKVRPEPGALERQFQGQRRRSVRRKTGAIALAATLAIVVGLVVVQIARESPGTKPKPASGSHTTITSQSIAHAYVEPPPTGLVVSGGQLYARLPYTWRGDKTATIVGFDTRGQTAGDLLSPFCGGVASGPHSPIWGGPSAADSATRCAPVSGFSASHTQRVVAGGDFVVAAQPEGSVMAFSPDCTDPGDCDALWSAHVLGGSSLALSTGGGLVFAFPRDYVGIYAFPSDCGMGNATCRPIWSWGTGDDGRPGRSVQAVALAGNQLYVAVTGLPRGGTVDRGGSKLYVFDVSSTA